MKKTQLVILLLLIVFLAVVLCARLSFQQDALELAPVSAPGAMESVTVGSSGTETALNPVAENTTYSSTHDSASPTSMPTPTPPSVEEIQNIPEIPLEGEVIIEIEDNQAAGSM